MLVVFSPIFVVDTKIIFRYDFIAPLITLISLSISLKTSNILENKSKVFERSDCTITVHNDLYHNELKI